MGFKNSFGLFYVCSGKVRSRIGVKLPPLLYKPGKVQKSFSGQVQWLMPIIPAIWEAKEGGLLEPRSFRPAWVTAKPCLYKNIRKLARLGGMCLWSQLLRRLKWEDCMSPAGEGCREPRLHHCTPAWTREQDPISKKPP